MYCLYVNTYRSVHINNSVIITRVLLLSHSFTNYACCYFTYQKWIFAQILFSGKPFILIDGHRLGCLFWFDLLNITLTDRTTFYRRVFSGKSTFMKHIFCIHVHDLMSSDICCHEIYAVCPNLCLEKIRNDFQKALV